MIKVSILYPNLPGRRFDIDHYLTVHMPLSIERLGPSMRSITVELGVSPGPPWPDAAFVAAAHFVCESREAYEAAFFTHMAELEADMPNYTDIEAVIQISEIAIDSEG